VNRIVSAWASAAVVILALGSGGFAADMPVKSPLSAANYNWSGWYVGANAGYGFSSSDTNIAGLDPGGVLRIANGVVPATLSENRTGLLGGLQLGANLQSGNIVYGFETDFDYAQVKGKASSTFNFIPPVALITSSDTKLNWLGTFRGRMGVAAFERSLFYATGGLAYGQATNSVNILAINNGACTLNVNLCASSSSQKWMAGWTAGAGWEWAFEKKWSAKLEYLYYDLGKLENRLTPENGSVGITFGSSTKVSGSVVRFGVNYKLGGL
jgi:outer membrane immunogenic protein